MSESKHNAEDAPDVASPAEAAAPQDAAPSEQQAFEPSVLEQLNAALTKADENWDAVLRTKAELENLRKRSQRDVENAHKYALEKIATELLAVRDSMELGLSAAQESGDIKSLVEGGELTLKLLTQVMDKFDIKEVNPVEQKFNPEFHQAVTTQESDQLEPNTVVSVMQKGYLLQDRLLRPALVTVTKRP